MSVKVCVLRGEGLWALSYFLWFQKTSQSSACELWRKGYLWPGGRWPREPEVGFLNCSSRFLFNSELHGVIPKTMNPASQGPACRSGTRSLTSRELEQGRNQCEHEQNYADRVHLQYWWVTSPCRDRHWDLLSNLSDNTRSQTWIYGGKGKIFHFDDTCFLNIWITLLTSRLERQRLLPPFRAGPPPGMLGLQQNLRPGSVQDQQLLSLEFARDMHCNIPREWGSCFLTHRYNSTSFMGMLLIWIRSMFLWHEAGEIQEVASHRVLNPSVAT